VHTHGAPAPSFPPEINDRDGMGWRSDGSSGTAALPDLAAGWRSAAGQVASRGESTPRGLSLSPYLSLFFENKKQK
jgi:hypothetical protein